MALALFAALHKSQATKTFTDINNNTSCSSSLFNFVTMELGSWCSSVNQSICWCQNYFKTGYDRLLYGLVTGSKIPRWRLLWRKVIREKKRIFDCSSTCTTRVHVPYDPHTYSQNFDQGFMWADPDNVSRTFSARFAVPSRVFEKS